MPLASRIIQPGRLFDGDPEENKSLDELTHQALCRTLLQLSSLATSADEIFSNISQECQSVIVRAERLTNRVSIIGNHIGNLDAKTVPVPVSDLKSSGQIAITDHHHTDYSIDGQLFSSLTRPDTICDLYEDCEASPVTIIRECNTYRTDGRCGGTIFSPAPVILNEKLTDPESTRLPKKNSMIITDRETKMPKKIRPQSLSAIVDPDMKAQSNSAVLPTPEDKLRELSRSQPIALIPIDVSGSGFDRQSDYRASQRMSNKENIEYETKSLGRKRNRRRTVSGIPGDVFEEISTNVFKPTNGVNLRARSASKERWERPRSVAMDAYAPRSEKKRQSCREKRRGRSLEILDNDEDENKLNYSCSLRRSLRSLFKGKRSKSQDLWMDSRPSSPEPRQSQPQHGTPLRRSRSLPRSLKNLFRESVSKFSQNRSASTEGRLDVFDDNCDTLSRKKKLKKRTGSSGSFKSLPRSRSAHSSLPHSSTFTEGSIGVSRPRQADPRVSSLDRRSSRGKLSAQSSQNSETQSIRSTSVSSMENTFTSVGGQHVHVNIPSKPWTKPFAKVKLRAPLEKIDRDDRHSSSGNWSGSSNSARQSLESEYKSFCPTERKSQHSDKDSAVSLCNPVAHDDRLEKVDETVNDDDNSTICDEDESNLNESASDVRNSHSKYNSDDWLDLRKSTGSTYGTIKSNASHSSFGSDYLPLSSGTNTLTSQNLKTHDNLHQPVSNYRPKKYLGDDESSIYSVDDQGFFTSMHKDCGVKKSTDDLSILENDGVSNQYSSNSTMSSYSERSKSKKSSILGKFASLKWDKKKKKVPPPPPPRGSAVLSKSNLQLEEIPPPDTPPLNTPTEIRKLASLAQQIAERKEREAAMKEMVEVEVHTADIHHDQISLNSEASSSNIKLKTSISTYPAMCTVSPDTSDEEDNEVNQINSAWNDFRAAIDPGRGMKSSKSAPERLDNLKSLQPVNPTDRVFLRMESIQEDSHEHLLDSSKDDTVLDTSRLDSSTGDSEISGFSTWPRSPTVKVETKMQGESRKCGSDEKPRSPPDKTDENTVPIKIETKNVEKKRETSRLVCPPAILDIARRSSVSKISPNRELSHECNDELVVPNKNVVPGTFQGQPLPASAQLIISSPVSSRACFVENPHKRSVCSPVTVEDLSKYQNYNTEDKWYNTLPRKHNPGSKETVIDPPEEPTINKTPHMNGVPKSQTSDEISSTSSGAKSTFGTQPPLKHSASFPSGKEAEKEAPSSYGRTWYDGVATKACLVEDLPKEKGRQKMSFTSFLKEPPTNINPVVSFRNRHDSNASTVSTNSSGSGKRSSSLTGTHRSSLSSLGARSSECSSISESIGVKAGLHDHTIEAVIIPSSYKTRLTRNERYPEGKMLSTFTPSPSRSQPEDQNAQKEEETVKSTAQFVEPKETPRAFSKQRHRGNVKRPVTMTTSFVGVNPNVTKQGESTQPSSSQNSSTSGKVVPVVSIENSRPIKDPMSSAVAEPKIFISANKAKHSILPIHKTNQNGAEIASKANNLKVTRSSVWKETDKTRKNIDSEFREKNSGESCTGAISKSSSAAKITVSPNSNKTSAFDFEPVKPTPRKFVPPGKKLSPVVREDEKGRSLMVKPNGILKQSLNKSTTDLSGLDNNGDRENSDSEKCKFKSLPRSRQNRWSVTDMSSSIGNLSQLSLSRLSASSASIARSTDSLASNSSLAERNRALKLSFLSTADDSAAMDTDSRFEKHKAKLSSSRTSLNSLHRNRSNSQSQDTAASTQREPQESRRNTNEKVSPVQGRFVSSLINQFQAKPSVESLSSPSTSNSSGLGSSLPGSPDSAKGFQPNMVLSCKN